jgi:hypothetical protein
MSANPRVVAVDTVFRWDGAPQRLARGTVLDVPPGSALLAAIGPRNLVPLGAKTPLPEPPVTDASTEEVSALAPQATGRSRKSAAKNGSNEGES